MSRGQIENVSDTALWVASFRADESRRTDALFDDPYAERLAGERGRAIAREMGAAAMMRWIMLVRTIAIDEFVGRYAKEVDAVLNIGAGLDARPYRLKLPPDLLWVEADFPGMIDYKTKILAGEKANCRLEREALDLTDRELRRRFLEKLAARAPRILVITEGVIPYLTSEDAAELARDLHSIPNVRYWVQDYTNGDISLRTPKRWATKMGSAAFKFRETDWFAFFARQGWVKKEAITSLEQFGKLPRRPPLFVLIWRLFLKIAPPAKREVLRNMGGYTVLERTKLSSAETSTASNR